MAGVVIFALISIAIITVINIVAVGYELVPIVSDSFNSSYKLWYDEFLPKGLSPLSQTCERAIINVNEGFLFYNVAYYSCLYS
jgi:hypothetical protein